MTPATGAFSRLRLRCLVDPVNGHGKVVPTVLAPDGTPLAWHEAGRGRPLLLLPGLSLGLACLAPLLPSRLGHRLAMDPRGVGDSRPWSGTQTADAYADDAVRVLDAAGQERVDLLALSFGAVLAQRLLVRHPDRVRRAVLLSCPVGHRPERVAVLERLAALGEAGDLRGLWAELAPWLVGRRLARNAELPLRAAGRLVPPLLLRTDGPAVAAELRAVLALPDSSADDLRGVRAPVLLVQGGRDRLAPPADTARLLSVLPDARAVVVARAGHLAPLRVRTVRRAVRAFLDAPEPAAAAPGGRATPARRDAGRA